MMMYLVIRKDMQFQSTLPAGEATHFVDFLFIGGIISIHASRGGSDNEPIVQHIKGRKFQSTLPAGEAT